MVETPPHVPTSAPTPPATPGSAARRHARSCLELLSRDPELARARAHDILEQSGDPAARGIAWLALGQVAHELGEGPAPALARAAVAAARGGLPYWSGQIRASALGILAHRGVEATPDRVGRAYGTDVQRFLCHGVALTQLGRFETAAAAFGAALVRLPREPNPQRLAALLSNRALAHLYAGRLAEADDDLARALELARRHGMDYLAAVVRQNLGCLAARRQDYTRAMAEFDAATPWFAARRGHDLALDRADALVTAGADTQAREVLRAVAPRGEVTEDRTAAYATTQLLHLRVALRDGEHAAARHRAHALREVFGPRSTWSAAARGLLWRAGAVPVTGRPHRAVPPASSPTLPPSVAATEGLPQPSGGLGDGLTHPPWEELRRAVRAADPAAVLRCVDAGMVPPRLVPEGGPDDGPLQERYRDARARLHRALVDPTTSGGRVAELRREVVRLRLASALTTSRRPPVTGPVPPADPADLTDTLDGRILGALTRLDGELLAVTVRRGVWRLLRLGALAPALDAGRALLFAARSRVLGHGDDRAVRSATARVERDVLAPLVAELSGSSPVVLVPGPLTGLPWGLLPRLRSRPVSVAPTAGAWLAAARAAAAVAGSPAAPRRRTQALLVGGPHLAHAAAETRALRGPYPAATVLTGAHAHRAAVGAALARCEVAHFAAHGLAATGDPLEGGVLLADGPFTVEDLRRCGGPALVVLSACGTAGVAAAALAATGGTVLASVVPVSDAAVVPAMVRAHQDLAAGAPPAQVVADHLAELGFLCLGAG